MNKRNAGTVTALLLLVLQARASQPQKLFEFEVASVKPMKSPPNMIMMRIQPGGRFVVSGVTAKFLMEQAYGVKDSQITGAPSWFNTDRWDIDAKPDEATAAALDKLSPDERQKALMQMLQGLLADRFKLTVAREIKDLPIYALVVAKNGPKFHESTYQPPETSPDTTPRPGEAPAGKRQGVWMNGRGELTQTDADMKLFADVLSRFVGRPVIDKTGLTGKYDFSLKWTPDEAQSATAPGGKGPGMDGASPPPPESSGPSIFTAVQEQLGLKLEPQKSPMEVFVIQHVERPSEN